MNLNFEKLANQKMELSGGVPSNHVPQVYVLMKLSSVTTLLTSNLNHNHEKSSNINRQIVANSLKRKAIDQIKTRPLKLIRNEVQLSAVDLTLNDVNSIRLRSVYRSRRKMLPPLPKNLTEVHAALTNLDTSTISTYKGENILLINDSILNIIRFSTKTN